MDHPKPKPPTVKLTPILPKKPEPKQIRTSKRPERKEHLTTNPFKNQLQSLHDNMKGTSK